MNWCLYTTYYKFVKYTEISLVFDTKRVEYIVSHATILPYKHTAPTRQLRHPNSVY